MATAKPKFGAGSFKAWLRMGLSELRNAIYPEGNVSRHVESGMWGTQTQAEITADRRDSAKKESAAPAAEPVKGGPAKAERVQEATPGFGLNGRERWSGPDRSERDERGQAPEMDRD